MNRRLGVLISGRGSNLQSIIDAIDNRKLEAEIAVVISNKPGAHGLARARQAGIETVVLVHQDYPSRELFDLAVVDELRARDVGLVCLAGFMRLLSPAFISAFPNAILNIHPSLLPAFVGLDAQGQAWRYGAKIAGATVHIVTAELDSGPIVCQAAVPINEADTAEMVASRILTEEHRIYPEAIKTMLTGRWRIEGRRFIS